MATFDNIQNSLRAAPRTWLITGVAGFIGSNLLEALLRLGQRVVGLDNFATGTAHNLAEVESIVGPEAWSRFRFLEGDLQYQDVCRQACSGVDIVLHQAALGSVPRSMLEPLAFHATNVTGFMNLLLVAREAGVSRVVYASSSAVYGDDPGMPKVEASVGRPLSPYAATKFCNELYAQAFGVAYGTQWIGLRYFNVFGPRQNPRGAYAAVIPLWIASLLNREPVYINGDGQTSRDFCFVENVVQANLLAATSGPEAVNQVYNIAVGERTTLSELFQTIQTGLRRKDPALPEQTPIYREFRAGDVRHSLADIAKARRLLGYAPTHRLADGLQLALDWYRRNTK
jgi:UDP-N-acetylglucosamine 4-epimerase